MKDIFITSDIQDTSFSK